MCGIIGKISDKPITKNDMRFLLSLLAHRGPDNQDYYHSPKAFLGHARLTIQDTISGNQPMSFEFNSKKYIFIYNGETYNAPELKKELLEKGITFDTSTDSEIVFKWLVVKGVKNGIYHLNGMFSFCLYNQSENILYLARDRFGIKPLYYTTQNNGIYFASELKSLMNFKTIPKILNKDAISQYFSFGIPLLPATFYKNVFELSPATLLTFNGQSLDIDYHKYWESSSYSTNTKISYNDAKDELDKILNTVIRDQLASDVGYSTFLSGGIDSSLVTALTNHHSSSTFNSYTVSFNDKDYDELPYAKQVAHTCEHVSHKVINSENFTLDNTLIDTLLNHLGQPFGDSSMIPTYFISQEVSKYEKVVLSGDGGDELFFGYESFDWHKKIQDLKRLPSFLRWLIKSLSPLIRNPNMYRQINKAIQYSYKNNDELLMCMSSVLDIVDYKELHCNSNLNWIEDLKTFYNNTPNSMYLKKQHYNLNYSLPSDMLRKVDRMSMAHGIEVRVPLLDNRIVDFALQLPLDFHFTKRTKKRLLKDVASQYLPDSVISHKKWGFCIPLHNAMPTSFIQDNLHLLRNQELIDSNFIANFIDYKMHATDAIHRTYSQFTIDHTIWMLILLFKWIKNEGVRY